MSYSLFVFKIMYLSCSTLFSFGTSVNTPQWARPIHSGLSPLPLFLAIQNPFKLWVSNYIKRWFFSDFLVGE